VPGPVKSLAQSAGVPVLQPERLRDAGAVEQVLSVHPDVIVVASYGQILPRILLEAPPFKALNLHPSLLPRYRGSSPISAPILAGDLETGTTLMLMSPRMDAGPVLDRRRVGIGSEETAGELLERLAAASARLLLDDLPLWLNGAIEPEPQNEAQATYTERLTKDDGEIDWTSTAESIQRQVRAFTPWPGAYSFWNGKRLKLLETRAGEGRFRPGSVQVIPGDGLSVGAGRGVLHVQRLQLAGGKPVSAAEFIRGHPDLAGAILGS
jgi:methionyl-tRNA formyltransferase